MVVVGDVRKNPSDMTPAELAAEKAYQEQHFLHLVSHMELQEPPKTWYGRAWRKWGEFVGTVVKILVGTVGYVVVISILFAIAKAVLSAI